jgi:cytochrome c biogenesis protein CcdA
MTSLSVLALGLFLGVRHATDADHLVAVSTVVTRERSTRSAMLVGAMWGVGHTVTIVTIGAAIVLFGVVIPARMGLWMEASVAAMLVVLGAMNMVGTTELVGEGAHSPLRTALPAAATLGGKRAVLKGRALAVRIRPFIIGVIHGLAGSATLALLVLTTIGDAGAAIAYLAVFGVGTVIGMMLLTAVLALPVLAASRRFASFERRLALITGAASVIFGVVLGYEVGIVEGLFCAAPH